MVTPRWQKAAGNAPAPSRLIFVAICFISALALMTLNMSLLFDTPNKPTHAEQAAAEAEPPHGHGDEPAHVEEPAPPPPPPVPVATPVEPAKPSRPSHAAEVVPDHFSRSDYATYKIGSHWPSWSNLDTVFIFGDSWTTTGFEVDGEQPSTMNTFGNPIWTGEGQVNGENWVHYLGLYQNSSALRVVNLAYGGGTVDPDLIIPVSPIQRGLKFQVQEWFLPYYYQNATTDFVWDTDKTLFIIWIGINDIHNAEPETEVLFPKVFERYGQYVDQLYQGGARNFAFMNIPPLERSPLAEKIRTIDAWGGWVHDWNHNLTTLAANLTESYSDATTFVYDTYKVYDEVIDEPCIHEMSCVFKDTTEFCWAYAFGTPELNYTSPNCPLAAYEYLWMNDLHPTSIMHNLTAHELALSLST